MARDESMSGKICLITGATSGIGEVAARALAAKGATLVLVGRNPEKTAAKAEAIRAESGNPNIEFLIADLSKQSEVRKLADEFKARHDRLHVLVNNAGAMFAERRESADGIELTFALNHLAYFLLTNLLLDTLKASAPSRVVSVSSYAHRMVPALNFDDLQFKKSYSGFKVYGASKLANILFTRELARRLGGAGVTANCLHPGFVATSFVEGNGLLGWWFRRMANLFAVTPEKGARTTIYLASSPEVEGQSGLYFAGCKPAKTSPFARDEAAARRLWEESEALTSAEAAHSA